MSVIDQLPLEAEAAEVFGGLRDFREFVEDEAQRYTGTPGEHHRAEV